VAEWFWRSSEVNDPQLRRVAAPKADVSREYLEIMRQLNAPPAVIKAAERATEQRAPAPEKD
jgi:hypothetical protein